MKRYKKFAALVLCLGILFNSTPQVQAGRISIDGIDYSSVFDAEYYYNTYSDVQTAIGHDADKLLQHFISAGMKEGRVGKADFNVRAYMKNNLDLLPVLGFDDLRAYYYHYIQSGKAEGRIATAAGVQTDINEISSFSTEYNEDEDRAVNIELASSRIDGIVIQPNETFSFSESILSRTLENGYKIAPSFANGRKVTSIGGGICQVSSTLYVTMLLSAIPATERYGHSLTVDYVPQGFDSAIVEGTKDLKFKNPYDYPICIHSTAKDGNLTVSISKVIENVR
ncbi:MAG: VanW family protein [Clostridiales bacterium]|nr:VanW family protein [Clostridiales bacterium]